MNKQLLDRREFGLCALGLPLCTISTMIAASSSASPLAAAIGTAPDTAGRRVKFRDGTIVPALGQGSAGLAQGRHPEAIEEEALRTGLSGRRDCKGPDWWRSDPHWEHGKGFPCP
jgi:hypothetical protein